MKTHVLIVAVVLIHVLAIGSVLCIQGCGTRRVATVEPPPAPVMPPREDAAVAPAPRPVFQPPVPVEPAPSMMVPTEGKTYTIQKGDSLSKIASRLGVSSRELAELNNIKDANKIRIGQVLALPDDARDSGAPRAKPAAAAKKADKAAVPEGASVYVVQAGDNLSKIASRQGVKLSALREANKLSSDKIMVGQKLMIPGASSAQPATARPAAAKKAATPAPVPVPAPAVVAEPKPVVPAPAPVAAPVAVAPVAPVSAVTVPAAEPKLAAQDQPLDYTAQENDTVESVARLFVVKVEDVMSLNGIADAKMPLKVGQKIKIPPTEY